MIQSMQCKIMIHNHQPIVGICQSVKCKMPHRLVCFKCVQSHLKESQCQIQDIKDEQELSDIMKDFVSSIDTRYENSIIYCQTQKIIKIKELQKYIEQWQDGYKKFDYVETIIKQIRQDLSTLNLETYLQDYNAQYTLDQYINNSIAQFTKLEKYLKGHPNFIIHLESKFQQSEQLNSIQDQMNKLNDKVQQDLQMNEEEILLFIKNKQEYKQNNEEILQYQLRTTQCQSNDEFVIDDEKNFYQLKLEYLKNNMIQGQGKLKIGLLDELLEFYKQIMRKLPNNLQVLESVAKTYVQKKQYSHALQQYNKCIQINPFEYRFYHNKANLLSNHLNKVDEALKCYEQYCEIDNTNYHAHLGKAQLYQRLDQYSRALSCFYEYIDIDPNYHKKQQFQKAYQDCCEQNIKFDKINRKINYITYIKKCQSHILQQDFKIALQLFNQYMTLDQNYFKKADLVNVILECCDQCINFDKTYIIAYMTKSNLLSQTKQFLTALQCYDLYIQTHSNDALQNDYNQIILECCDRFIIDDLKNPVPYIKKAQILQYMNDYQAAIKCFDQYRNIDANYFQNSKIHPNIIVEFLEAFMQCCDKYIDNDQQNYLPYIKKAQIQEENQDFQAAFKSYNQYMQINVDYNKIINFMQVLLKFYNQYIFSDKQGYPPSMYKSKDFCFQFNYIWQQQKNFEADMQYIDQIRILIEKKNHHQINELYEALIGCCYKAMGDMINCHFEYRNKSNCFFSPNLAIGKEIYTQSLYFELNYKKNRDKFQMALPQCCDQFIKNEMNNYFTYLIKAQILQQMSDFRAAIKCFDQYKNIDVNYYQNNEFIEAFIQCCNKYIDYDKSNHLPYYMKAQILEEKQDYQSALSTYELFIQRNPGEFQRNDSLYTSVIKCCDLYMMYNYDDQVPYFRKGQILRQKGYFTEAQHFYDQYIKKSNKQNIYEAILNKGKILEQDKQYREAILCFEKCIEIDPQRQEAKSSKNLTEYLIQRDKCVIQ